MTESQIITTTSAGYDAHSLEEYATKWVNNMDLGEMAINDTRKVSADGVISLSAESGSLEFSVDIAAATPGTEPGWVIHGSYTGTPDGGRPYAQSTIEGQQAALMFNMTNVETGQLFDWFVSGS